MHLGQRLAAIPSPDAGITGLQTFECALTPIRKVTDRRPIYAALLAQRSGERDRWLAYLEEHNRSEEAKWLREVWVQMQNLRERRNTQLEAVQALNPYKSLVGWWIVGIMLLRQLGVLLALWGGAILLIRFWPRQFRRTKS